MAAPVIAQQSDQTAQTPAATEPLQSPTADLNPADKKAANAKSRAKTVASNPVDAKTDDQKPLAKSDDEVAKASSEDPSKIPVDGVAVIVNDSVVSEYDVRQRMGLFFATTGTRPTDENKAEVREQVLKQLESERLQLLEAQKKNVAVSTADVDAAIDDILKDNNLKKEQLEEMFSRAGVRMSTFRAQIAAQLAWAKLVGGVYGDQLNLTDEEVNAELKRIKASATKPHFLVAEIFEAVDSPEQDEKVKKDIQGLADQLHTGAQFPAVARQFSQSPTAAQGGDLGVVAEGDLPPILNDALVKMHPGDISDPIRGTGGYYVLMLRERQEPAGTKIVPVKVEATGPAGTLPLARVLLPIGPSPSKALLQNAVKAAQFVKMQITSCARIPEILKKLPGAVYMNLGQMRVADLSPQIQGEVNKTGPGESTDPFQSPAGVELIARCDKAPPKPSQPFPIPTFNQVKSRMYEEQMSVYARRYMRDLRRDASIEVPGEKDKKLTEAAKPKLHVKAQ
ncbi:MAG: peptidylprolyl isomerase [Proteobacteria bacterium]|nr:peptidylprolyl isomerase [Pseudomonadota bacterium]